MRFLTRLKHLHNSRVSINSNSYEVNSSGIIDVTNPADVETLKKLTKEWTTDIVGAKPASEIVKSDVPKGAAEFLTEVNGDAALLERLTKARSPVTRRSLIKELGFKFTDTELLDAALASDDEDKMHLAEVVIGKPVKKDPPPKGKTGKAPAATKWKIPDIDAGEEWPDPVVTMPEDYLRAMAESYDVTYPDGVSKAEIIPAIHAKMYPTP